MNATIHTRSNTPGTAEPFGALSKIKASTATEVCELAGLSNAGCALLTPELGFGEFLAVLMEQELLIDAVAIMAHALPKREAVWWACLAARAVVDDETPEEIQSTLESAEAWVYKSTDEMRRAAMAQAHKTQFDHAAVWAAVGAFWSGGSMVAPELPAVPPAEHLTGLAVSGAVKLSVLAREPEKAPEKFRALLAQAIDIAKGGSGRPKKGGESPALRS